MTVTGVILAGGVASRFDGRPKGLESVGGRRIVDRVADALRAACDDLLLVANASGAGDWLPGVRVAADVLPGRGALGGLHAALAHAGGPALVVAWDMPFVAASLLVDMRDALADGVDAVVPIGPAGAEPLCALYTPRCLAAAERLLASGERRARALGESVATRWLGVERVARHGDPALLLSSVNAPAELARADALSRAARPVV